MPRIKITDYGYDPSVQHLVDQLPEDEQGNLRRVMAYISIAVREYVTAHPEAALWEEWKILKEIAKEYE